MPARKETYPFMGAQYTGGQQRSKQRPILQPVLPIVIWSPDGSKGIPVKAAMVDTGADTCMCPSNITKLIGHKIRSGKRITFGGAVSSGKAWEHFVNISIMTHDYRAIFHTLSKVPLYLIQRRKASPILLGRNGFLDQFLIQIDSPNKLLTLEIP